jgi:hypothetical protein
MKVAMIEFEGITIIVWIGVHIKIDTNVMMFFVYPEVDVARWSSLILGSYLQAPRTLKVAEQTTISRDILQ